MMLFQRCVPEGASIVSVQAPLPDSLGGFSWWNIEQGRKPSKEEVLVAAGQLEGFITRFENRFELSPKKRIAFGFSQGGGVLSAVLQKGSVAFDGLAFLASFVIPLGSFGALSLECQQKTSTEIFWGHGTLDEVISIERARKDVSLLQQSGFVVHFFEDSIGHKIGARSFRELQSFSAKIVGKSDSSRNS